MNKEREQQLSPGQQRALERQRRLVATLPKTREQAEELQQGLAPGVPAVESGPLEDCHGVIAGEQS